MRISKRKKKTIIVAWESTALLKMVCYVKKCFVGNATLKEFEKNVIL